MKNYFGSDFHLEHKNIIKYDKRPFRDIEHMNSTIIDNCASVLKKGDNFYYLGDFCFASSNKAEGHMKALSYTGASLFFIKGNHDRDNIIELYQKYGTYLGEQKRIAIEGQDIILNHYAMRVWDKSHRGAFHLYGHSHDNLEYKEWGKSMDVGVVSAYRIKGEYTIFEYQELKHILSQRQAKIVDHHGDDSHYE